MANEKEHLLFRSAASWDLSKLPAHVQNMGSESTDPADRSSLNDGTSPVRLNGFITKAIYDWARESESEICVIKILNGAYASEWNKSGTYILAYANDKGDLNVSTCKDITNVTLEPLKSLGNANDSTDTTSIISCYLALIMETEEGAAYMKECCDQYHKSKVLPKHALFKLNGLIQESLKQGKVNCKIPNGAVKPLLKDRITSRSLNGKILAGSSKVLMPGEVAVNLRMTPLAEAKKLFKAYASTQHWTPEEEARIKSFPDDYLVPEEVIEMANWFVESRGDRLPANNFCWLGCTGAGKSISVALLSCILHKPLYIMTCSSNMETGDFLSTLVPASTPALAADDLPNIDDITLDPVGAYQRLTGKTVDDIPMQKVLLAYGDACAARAGKDTYFKRVKSEYIRALESGAICEIQEFSRIRDAGVLVGLNEYDHAGAVIPLIDGEYTVRHPDAITVWTDNIGYNSCRPVDPSVMRRMDSVFQTFELDKTTVVERAMYNTNNALDRPFVAQMFDVWQLIKNFCAKEDLTEGDLSPTDFENWISRVAHTGYMSLYDTCSRCCVAKTTREKATQDQIYTGIVMPAIDQIITWYENREKNKAKEAEENETAETAETVMQEQTVEVPANE